MNTKHTAAGVLLALVSILATTAQASNLTNSTPFTNFQINSSGNGLNGNQITVADFLDLTGSAYVNNTFTSSSTFNFREVATFSERTADSETEINPILRANFVGSGEGIVGGLLTFTNGTLNLQRSDFFQFASFNLKEGSATLGGTTPTLPNDAVSLIFTATSLERGYIFDSLGNDLADRVGSGVDIVFGFSTTNSIARTGTVSSSLITLFNNSFEPDVVPPVTTGSSNFEDLFLSTNGQFRLATAAVPVPAAFWLLGSGLAGLMTLAKRKKLAA